MGEMGARIRGVSEGALAAGECGVEGERGMRGVAEVTGEGSVIGCEGNETCAGCSLTIGLEAILSGLCAGAGMGLKLPVRA